MKAHRGNEFDEVVFRRTGRYDFTPDLQVTPLHGTLGTVEDENHTLPRPLDTHFHEALEERRAVEVEDAGKCLDAERPSVKPVIQYQNGRFHNGVSRAILLRRLSVLG